MLNKQYKYSFWKDWIIMVAFVVVTNWIEKTCLYTLLPICIPWMYYQFALIVLYVMVDPVTEYFRKKNRKSKKKHFEETSTFSLKLICALIIIQALLFLPNRYFSIKSKSEHQGVVIDKTSWALTRTAFWNNYAKIKSEDTNISFWCNTKKESKPLGTKCIITTRRGLFGINYVEKVDFLVE